MKVCHGIILGAVCLISTVNANATVLTFDDFTTSSTDTPLADSNYGGFQWTNMGVLSATLTSGGQSGHTNGHISGEYLAFNYVTPAVRTSTGEITRNEAFDFDGAFFVGAWNNGLNLEISGYSGSVLLYTKVVDVDTTKPTWFQADYLGITSLTIKSSGGNPAGSVNGKGINFGMDDFTFNSAATPVPEPATMLLFGTGLVGLAGLTKRKKEKLNSVI